MKKKMNKKWWIGIALIEGVVLVGVIWFFFFRDDAPEAVSTEPGLEQLQEDLAATDDDQDNSATTTAVADSPTPDAADSDTADSDVGPTVVAEGQLDGT